MDTLPSVDDAADMLFEFDDPAPGSPEHHVNTLAAKARALAAVRGTQKGLLAHIRAIKAYRDAYARCVYRDSPPDEVPTDILVGFVRSPINSNETVSRYRARINSPLSAIRAMCVMCQGGNLDAVRDCPSRTCTLWPFRLGNNPFFGRVANADAAAQED